VYRQHQHDVRHSVVLYIAHCWSRRVLVGVLTNEQILSWKWSVLNKKLFATSDKHVYLFVFVIYQPYRWVLGWSVLIDRLCPWGRFGYHTGTRSYYLSTMRWCETGLGPL